MLYMFVAVLAVLLVMNVFMLFVLKQMAGATGRQVEKDAGRLFGIYDAMLEKKSERLKELKWQEEELLDRLEDLESRCTSYGRSEKSSFVPTSPAKRPEFCEQNFAHTYNQIKEVFSMPQIEFAADFQKSLPAETEEESRRRELLSDMRKLLSFDNLYRISILEPDQQKLLLEQIFTEEQAEVYRQWKASGQGAFVTDFADWLDRQLTGAERRIVVKTAKIPLEETDSQQEGNGECMKWEEDPSICEGVKILYQNRLYDYSI